MENIIHNLQSKKILKFVKIHTNIGISKLFPPLLAFACLRCTVEHLGWNNLYFLPSDSSS
jgi:hypothetical protein